MDLIKGTALAHTDISYAVGDCIFSIVSKVNHWKEQHPNVSATEVDSKVAPLVWRWLLLEDMFNDLQEESRCFLDEYEDTEDKGGNDNDDDESEDATDDA